jgi:hypothetical protein
MSEPTPKPFEGIGDAVGRSLHGDRWPEVRDAARAHAKKRAARKALADRVNSVIGTTLAAVIVLALAAYLAASVVAAWRWAL